VNLETIRKAPGNCVGYGSRSIVEKARAWMVGLVGVGSEDVKRFGGLASR